MSKRYQLKSTNLILKANNNLLVIITLFLTITVFTGFIIIFESKSITPINVSSYHFVKNDVKELYVTEDIEIEIENPYYVRYEINDIVDEESINFYTRFTKNREIAKIIINNALKNNVPINLAFALSWRESKYDPNEEYDNDWSVDRGLFQLNNHYRQDWTLEEFFDPDINAYEGTRYLKEMIDLNEGDHIYALYCYNAGPNRVRTQGIIPESTKRYVNDILEYEDMLTKEFNKWIID